MLYIHKTTCISPQQTFPPNVDMLTVNGSGIDLEQEFGSVGNTLKVIEPSYESMPKNALRRMSKSVRIGVGAALPLIQQGPAPAVDGIIIGTANAGMEESIQFMKQIIDHEEGILAPGTFVQSTPNTIASQISFLSGNKGYNITHVQSGLAFENALLDAAMLLKENPLRSYLLGAADEIGAYNYNIDYLEGWYKKEPLSSKQLYEANSPGSLAGEGAAMFLVNNLQINALAKVQALKTIHSEDESFVKAQLHDFLDAFIPKGEKIDLLLTGENGDNRLLKYSLSCEAICEARGQDGKDVTIARFKHMSGEYPTASAFALWLACYILENQFLPAHMIKKASAKADTVYKHVLICNSCKGKQHSFILVSRPEKSR